MQVVLIDAVTSQQDLENKVRSAKCLKVRGPVIAAWAEHAVHVRCGTIQLDQPAVDAYRAMGNIAAVPQSLVTSAVASGEEDLTTALHSLFTARQAGPAGVRHVTEEHVPGTTLNSLVISCTSSHTS
jgi:hypothetical protein